MDKTNDPSHSSGKAEALGADIARLTLTSAIVSPRIGWPLITALEHRKEMLSLPDAPQWFRALDVIIHVIELCREGFSRDDRLRTLDILLARAERDFQAGLDGALSGNRSATFDAMRDVMEIEYLLFDFCIHPEHIDKWINPKNRKEKDLFQPKALRRRQAEFYQVDEEDLRTARDYRNHSQSLHVNPEPFGTLQKGIAQYRDPESMFPIWELLLHSQSLGLTLMMHASGFADDLKEKIENAGLEHVERAHSFAQERLSNIVKEKRASKTHEESLTSSPSVLSKDRQTTGSSVINR